MNSGRFVERDRHRRGVTDLLASSPCVAILGARQVGKTTLAAQIRSSVPVAHVFDLERPGDVARLQEPELTLERLTGLIVIDEIQRRPDLFPVLRWFLDAHPDRRVLLLGSASPDLLAQSSETLAGRIAYYDLTPFTVDEVGSSALATLWTRGGFPRSFLAASDAQSFRWRLDFVRTFVERDLPTLGSRVPAATTDRFWRMLAHVHGQVWNSARFASSFGVSDTTVRRYLDTLTSSLVVRQLLPWHANVSKRQVRSPKVFVADTGILHALLDLPDMAAVERHPVLGASWEGFVLAQLGVVTGARPDQQFFWATHGGAELDLLVVSAGQKIGFEIKRTATPKLTRSLRSAIDTLDLDAAYVIHAGEHTVPLGNGVQAIPASKLLEQDRL